MAVYEVVISGTIYGQLWQNRLHFQTVEGFVGDAQTIAGPLNNVFVFWYKQMMHSATAFTNINVKNISGPADQFILANPQTGAQAAENQNLSFAAVVIQKKTGLAGKANRGRLYAPGHRQGGTQQGKLVGNELANWQLAMNNIAQNFINPLPHNFKLVIKHPEGTTDVTSLVVRDVLGVIRTRNIAVGA
jgi:hypothetical protein